MSVVLRDLLHLYKLGCAGAALVAVILAGCGAPGPGAPAAEGLDAGGIALAAKAMPFHRRPPARHDAGVTAAPEVGVSVPPVPPPPSPPPVSAGSGSFDCTICTRAQDCCDAVAGGPLCTFSAATCGSLSALSQASYVQSCAALIRITIDAWTSSAKTPPAVCTLK